jgi:hypothetical protein
MASKGPQRLLYKRFLVGDDRKVKGRSNISKTGGGARDVRFGPWEKFEDIVKVMFPETTIKMTRRKDPRTGKYARHEAVVHVGTLLYQDDLRGRAQMAAMAVEFWEPTGARAFEGRLARAGKLPPFRPGTMPAGKGSVFMLLAQDANGMLGGTWVTEHALRNHQGWYKPFQQALLDALDGASATANVRGFIDLQTGEQCQLIGRVRG